MKTSDNLRSLQPSGLSASTRPGSSDGPKMNARPPPLRTGSGTSARSNDGVTPDVVIDPPAGGDNANDAAPSHSAPPPSRPPSGLKNGMNIDDLLGPPTARKRGGVKKKKSSRYVDVMAQKANDTEG